MRLPCFVNAVKRFVFTVSLWFVVGVAIVAAVDVVPWFFVGVASVVVVTMACYCCYPQCKCFNHESCLPQLGKSVIIVVLLTSSTRKYITGR